jgi:serine/threonine protein kinase
LPRHSWEYDQLNALHIFHFDHDMATLDDYHLGQVIAKGSFGAEIRHGRYKSDRTLHVSIKCVSKRSLVRRRSPTLARSYGLAVVREQRLLKQFSGNQCVPKLYACFHNADFVVTVTQCCTGGFLQEVIASLLAGPAATTTSTIIPHWREHCAIQMFDILVFLHTSSIVHCDLSPSVLHLTADGNLRLVDLGYAVDLKQTNRLSIRPQTPYSAPELWHNDDNDNDDNDKNNDQEVVMTTVSTAVDLWSAGCICFAMHTGHSPFANIPPPSSPSSAAAAPPVVSQEQQEESMKPAARDDNNNDDVVDAEVGKRIAAFTKEYIESTKKHPQLLDELPHDSPSNKSVLMSMSSWRETIYELLHPDPLHRTQAAAMDTTGNLYDAMRVRFLLPTTATTTNVTFRPPVPHWLREEEGSSGDESIDDTTKSE